MNPPFVENTRAPFIVEININLQTMAKSKTAPRAVKTVYAGYPPSALLAQNTTSPVRATYVPHFRRRVRQKKEIDGVAGGLQVLPDKFDFSTLADFNLRHQFT